MPVSQHGVLREPASDHVADMDWPANTTSGPDAASLMKWEGRRADPLLNDAGNYLDIL